MSIFDGITAEANSAISQLQADAASGTGTTAKNQAITFSKNALSKDANLSNTGSTLLNSNNMTNFLGSQNKTKSEVSKDQQVDQYTGLTVNTKADKNSPTNVLTNAAKKEFEEGFAAMSMSTGFAAADDSNYYTCYNSMHDLPYFNPYSTGNLHIFITRPQLNLSPANLAMSNEMLQCCYTQEGCLLLASLTDNLHKNLDYYSSPANNSNSELYKSMLYDGKNPGGDTSEGAFYYLKTYGIDKLGITPFIPIMSNLSVSISGMKDFVLEKYEYDGDQAGNKTADPTGMDESKSSGECTIGCIETSNASLSMLNYIWELYMDLTGKGLQSPTDETIENLEYDYQSSIYWFVTGQDGLSIKLYGKLTGCYPINVPITSLIPSERGSHTNSRIDFTYHYNHHELNNPEILYDFNYTIDQALSAMSKKYLENDPIYNNDKIKSWIKNNFSVSTTNPDKNINDRWNRMMETSKGVYDKSIFQPNIQNEWLGHPYIYNGMLVYRSAKKLESNETDLNDSGYTSWTEVKKSISGETVSVKTSEAQSAFNTNLVANGGSNL